MSLTRSSAIYMLIAWYQQYGRWPLARDCVPHNNLPHWTTLYRLGFSSFSAMFALADRVMQNGMNSNELPREIECLQCGARIVWEGPHVRHCASCRFVLFAEDNETLTPYTVLPEVSDDEC